MKWVYTCCTRIEAFYEQIPTSVNEHTIVIMEKNPKLNAATAEKASAK